MITQLKLLNLPAERACPLIRGQGEFFVLQTCQRYLLLGFEPLPDIDPVLVPSLGNSLARIYRGPAAYRFMLEIICGLQSQLLAEQEITSQFRAAFRQYATLPHKDPDLLLVLEKLLKDNKDIRHRYLQGLGQQSYAGICRYLLNKNAPHHAVLILGTGELCLDLIKLLHKRYQIHLSGRNEAVVRELCQRHGLVYIPWKNDAAYAQFPNIINTIGDETTLLWASDFFEAWQAGPFREKIFIDLGIPSVIRTADGVANHVFRLPDLFKIGNTLDEQKKKMVVMAHRYIAQLCTHRAITLRREYLHSDTNNLTPIISTGHGEDRYERQK
jgi:glutamyl-tRNA reductase